MNATGYVITISIIAEHTRCWSWDYWVEFSIAFVFHKPFLMYSIEVLRETVKKLSLSKWRNSNFLLISSNHSRKVYTRRSQTAAMQRNACVESWISHTRMLNAEAFYTRMVDFLILFTMHFLSTRHNKSSFLLCFIINKMWSSCILSTLLCFSSGFEHIEHYIWNVNGINWFRIIVVAVTAN